MSAFLRFKTIQPWSILIGKLLTLSLPGEEEELNRFRNKIRENDLADALQTKFRDYLGLGVQEFSADNLESALQRIYYNRIVQTLPDAAQADPYRELKIKAPDALVYFNQFLQEVDNNPRVRERLEEALSWAGEKISGPKLIAVYGPDATFAMYALDMLWEVMTLEQESLGVNPGASIKRLEQLSLQRNLPETLATGLQFMIHSARMFERINSIRSYILNRPEEYVEIYTREWMLIDTVYRKAIRTYWKLDISEVPEKVNLEKVREEVNSRYERYIDAMNREWLKCLNQYGFQYQDLSIPRQYDFFQREVAPYEQKVVVIISDALRYEAAADLLATLHGDPQNTADIRYQLASIPSKTHVGMAQLLPEKDRIFNDGAILIDGINSGSIANRQKILEAFSEDAVALSFSDIQGRPSKELRDIFKKRVVYIYHDVIDSTGDKRSSERRVFQAVDDTFEELQRFVKSLHATFNVAKVLITSDHGFLYNDREIEEKDKEGGLNPKAQYSHNRFEISEDPAPPVLGYKLPLSATTTFKEPLYVTIPSSVNRYKKQGVGHQYVHGGAACRNWSFQ